MMLFSMKKVQSFLMISMMRFLFRSPTLKYSFRSKKSQSLRAIVRSTYSVLLPYVDPFKS